ncbi:Mucin-desulfating sulfatase (N-acetylglucosamine-6-sulfatase) [Colletotrichum scovillei]|uniref:Mucin-desulfating sulfatase (N-acetylglucosamine-6-sulfatase) n=1 Tax=Colletotrichum scovillei TaxID=1209932 RepID=A0A9P7R4G8_9PEZI|nr:Mucin-desulfating sulfatase (N-acetylglucosamine-6-sulfatase) [Colletotrichum scovillei]KAG7065240.1 Mucin-desulfating sulfatase (N-acetylglucosamine-6-sulfatase) [Colletotrichum scovillei]KAG7067842.1 Mucin-desulfating sulfatase (N-acetylglucosamine-6-sulfatase) [Colletotrichum scovillei]
MKFSTVILFVASVAAVALDTDVPPALSQPGRRGVDCGACDRLNFCPGKPNNNVECELDGCCKNALWIPIMDAQFLTRGNLVESPLR